MHSMNTVLSRLELAWRIRQGAETRKHRDYLDFVIDGRSLGDLLGAAQSDLIGRLGWGDLRGYDYQFKRQLLLESPSELETGRQLLYVCPECGDVGCGAITV